MTWIGGSCDFIGNCGGVEGVDGDKVGSSVMER